MKIKYIFASVLALLCSVLFVACGGGRNVTLPKINSTRYLASTVATTYVENNVTLGPKNMSLSYFIENQVNKDSLKAHKTLVFKGTSWMYKMYIEAVYFYFYCSDDKPINQLEFTMVDLDGGQDDDTSLPEGTYRVHQKIAIDAKSHKGCLVRVDIGHKVLDQEFSITLSMANETSFNGSYSWTIYGLAIYGETRI